MEKVQLAPFEKGVARTVNVPMRIGGDPGKWTDCVWAIAMITFGWVVNFCGRVRPWNRGAYFKGVEVIALVDEYPCLRPGQIIVSSGGDSDYDVRTTAKQLMQGRFKKSNIILATLSMIDWTPLYNHSLHITIASGVPAGASVGSSAAVQLALLYLLCGAKDPYLLAQVAIHAEINIAKRAAGNQDPLSSAYGAVQSTTALSIQVGGEDSGNLPSFPDAEVRELRVGPKVRHIYNRCGVLTVIGSHDSSTEHALASARMQKDEKRGKRILKSMRDCAKLAEEAIREDDVKKLAAALQATCKAHRRIHPKLIGEEARAIIKLAEEHEALCSMMPGAGGNGGSVLSLFSTPEDANAFAEAVRDLDFRPYHIRLT